MTYWKEKMKLNLEEVKPLVEIALREDIGSGDITTWATVPAGAKTGGRIVAKERGVLAGLEIAELVFKMVKKKEKIQFRTKVKDGDKVKKGQVVAEISGPVRSILMAERTALNFLQRLSGVATFTAKFVDRVRPYRVKIMDTRKTTPGWRALEKYAVRLGGGSNHRQGLYDGVLIKDNHIKITPSPSPLPSGERIKVREKRKFLHNRVMSEKKKRETAIGELIGLVRKKVPPGMKIEVEASNLRETREAVQAGADIIMLDNMNREQMKKAVKIVHTATSDQRPLLEASGGVNLDTVKEIARMGVDMISVGALTHSAKGLDMSLELDPLTLSSPLRGED